MRRGRYGAEGSVGRERRRVAWALALWVAHAAVLLAGTVGLPAERQRALGHYRAASDAWIEGRPLYREGSEHGFLYLPAFAVAHVPFARLPLAVGATLWRAVNLTLFGWGLWVFARALGRERRGTLFLGISAVALACSWSTGRHGQATLAMAGAMLAGAGLLAERRPTAAAVWLAVGVAVKPLAVVEALLVAALWRGMAARLAVLALVVLLLPFLAQAPGYVLAQYEGFGRMLLGASDPADRGQFIDVFQALARLGVEPPVAVVLGLRVGAGAAALGALAWVRRRADERASALLLYALAAAYLLAFNPRTEANTFALVGPALGASAAWALLEGRRRTALAFVALALALRVDFDVTQALFGRAEPWTRQVLLAVAGVAVARHARRAGWRFLAAPAADGPSAPPAPPGAGTPARA